MAYLDWMIRGPKIGACNCAYGGPCDFNAPPTDPGRCEGVDDMRIEEGHYGKTHLDRRGMRPFLHRRTRRLEGCGGLMNGAP